VRVFSAHAPIVPDTTGCREDVSTISAQISHDNIYHSGRREAHTLYNV
jgi:hypothetical protein